MRTRFGRGRDVAVACLCLALAAGAIACGGGDDGGGEADAAEPSTTTAPADGDGLQILATSADGLTSPTLDALVQGTYVLPGVAVTASGSTPADPAAPPPAPGAPPVTGFATTASGYPAVGIQSDPVTAITTALAGDVEGIPAGIDLVVVGLNEGALLGPLAGFDADIAVAQAAAAAGVPAVVLAAGLDEVPPDRAAALEQLAKWFDEHGDALRAGERPAEVTVLNVPGCGFAEVRGVIEVPVATDEGGRDVNAVDCTSTEESPADDIAAFTMGYAVITVLPAAAPEAPAPPTDGVPAATPDAPPAPDPAPAAPPVDTTTPPG